MMHSRKLATAHYASIVLSVLFPFYLWLVGRGNPLAIGAYLFAVGLLRLLASLRATTAPESWGLAMVAIMLGLFVMHFGEFAGLYYPAAISVAMLFVFSASFFTRACAVQRIAEKMEKQPLDLHGVAYTRKVTLLWCGFFAANAVIASWLAYHREMEWWLLYNGFISYVLIGVLLVGEMVVRRWHRYNAPR